MAVIRDVLDAIMHRRSSSQPDSDFFSVVTSYKQTAAELSAGVTPTNYSYAPLNPFRYGADGSGGSNDSTAWSRVNLVLAQLAAMIDWQGQLSVPGYPLTVMETVAAVALKSYRYAPDGENTLNIFRFLTSAQRADILAGTANSTTQAGVAALIQAANDYLEGRAPGSIASLSGLVAGTGYNGGNPGTFTFVPLAGGSGTLASATVVVGAAGAISSITIANPGVGNPGNGYAVGNTLSLTSANMVSAGAAAGGSGATINVATLATGGKTSMPGGTLYFPGGRYYCGSTGLRIGDMVEWRGNQFSAARLTWSNSFTGNAVTLGPDQSGFSGRSGFYCMGTVIDNIYLELGNLTAWGIITTGAQQNCTIRNLWINGISGSGGISLQDHKGSVYFKVENVYLQGGGSMGASVVGIHCDFQSFIEINRVSFTGGNQNFLKGIEIVSGGQLISNVQAELCVTAVEIGGSTGEYAQVIDCLTASTGTTRAVWIHSGFTGSVAARGINVSTGVVPIRNDNTNENKVAPTGGEVVPLYEYTGTTADISTAYNVVLAQAQISDTYGATVSVDAAQANSHIITVTNNSAFTISAPTINGSAIPNNTQNGKRLLIRIRNTSGGALGVITWVSAYQLAGAFTNPATGFSRAIEFEFFTNAWFEVSRTAADVAN